MSSTPRTRGTGFVGFEVMGHPDRPAWKGTPLMALVAQLKARAAQGEDPETVLDDVGLKQPQVRAKYLAAAGLDGGAQC